MQILPTGIMKDLPLALLSVLKVISQQHLFKLTLHDCDGAALIGSSRVHTCAFSQGHLTGALQVVFYFKPVGKMINLTR